MVGRHRDKVFKLTYLVLISLTLFFLTYILIREVKDEKNKLELTKNSYYQRVIGENNSKFSVLQTHLNYIKTEDRFISFIENEEVNYYEVTRFQKELKKTGTLFANLGYSIGITSLKNDMVINFRNTAPRRVYMEGLKLEIPYEDLMEKLKGLEVSQLFFEENRDSLVLFIRDRELKFGESFFWIVVLDKKKFFNHFDRDMGEWYFSSGDKKVSISQDSSEIYALNRGKLQGVDFFKGDFILDREGTQGFSYRNIAIKYPVVLILLGFLVYAFAKKLMGYFYSPFDRFIEEIDEGGEDQDSVEQIRNIYSRLSEKNESLKAQIKSTGSIVQKKKIKDYLLGIESEGRELFTHERYCVAAIEFLESKTLENFYSKEIVMGVKGELENLLSAGLKGDFIEIDHRTISYICASQKGIEEDFREIIEEIDRRMGVGIVIGYIDDVTPENLPTAYKETLSQIDLAFIYNKPSVIGREELEKFKNMGYYYPVKIEAQLITKVVNEDFKGAKKIIRDILEENFIERTLGREEKQEFLFILTNSFKRAISRLKIKGIEVTIDLHSISKSSSYTELEEECMKVLSLLEERMKREDSRGGVDIREELTRYIRENYSDDITLDTLADHMGHSLKYTSYLFKKVIGENFKYTLNKYRVERAKECMRSDPGLKVKEISRMVGFNSDTTFIRIFKKFEGTSPGRYASAQEGRQA